MLSQQCCDILPSFGRGLKGCWPEWQLDILEKLLTVHRRLHCDTSETTYGWRQWRRRLVPLWRWPSKEPFRFLQGCRRILERCCDNKPCIISVFYRFFIVSAALPATAEPAVRAVVTTLLFNRNDSDKSLVTTYNR